MKESGGLHGTIKTRIDENDNGFIAFCKNIKYGTYYLFNKENSKIQLKYYWTSIAQAPLD